MRDASTRYLLIIKTAYFKPLYFMNWNPESVHLLRKPKLLSTAKTKMVSTFMQNQISVTHRLLLNTSADIWDVLLSPLHVLINTMGKMSLSITPGTRIIRPLKSAFPLSISSNDLLFISRKNILKCCVTTVSTPDIINRKRNFADAFPRKSGNFYILCRTGVIPSFSVLVMTLSAVLIVVLPCRFWKFTTKKLHYLNNIERPCVPDNSKITFVSI